MNSNRTNPKYVLLEMYHFKLISVVIPAHLAGLKRVEGFFGKFQIMETYGAYMLLDLRTTCALRPCSTRANLAHFVHKFRAERAWGGGPAYMARILTGYFFLVRGNYT